jgi:glycosyltransferase involved in cell wall biosynthesis
VPTRHRLKKLTTFIESISNTTKKTEVEILAILDNPNEGDESLEYLKNLATKEEYSNVRFIENKYKSGLSKLWNQCIIESKTDWILLCNDDGIFMDGWLEYLTEQINSGKYLQIHLMHYGGFAIHKKMILLNGWFDERFECGGFEDNDWQLRLSESNLYNMVLENTNNFVFMYHDKYTGEHTWLGLNQPTMVEKWDRANTWRAPAFRRLPEKNWYPNITKEYESTYGVDSRIDKINTFVNSNRKIYHNTLGETEHE